MIRLILLLILVITFQVASAQPTDLKYRGQVICDSVMINDTLRRVCDPHTHPDNIEYLRDLPKENFFGELKLVHNHYIPWNGKYSYYDPKGTMTDSVVYRKGKIQVTR